MSCPPMLGTPPTGFGPGGGVGGGEGGGGVIGGCVAVAVMVGVAGTTVGGRYGVVVPVGGIFACAPSRVPFPPHAMSRRLARSRNVAMLIPARARGIRSMIPP